MYDLTLGFCLGGVSEKRVLREVLSNSFLGNAEPPPKPAQNPLEWNNSFFFRPETAPPEHRLWELPGQWSLPAHGVCHRWQAEGEDGGGVPSHEEPRLWAPGKFSGLHHVSTSCSWTAFEMLVLFQTWELSKQLSTLSTVPVVFYGASWIKWVCACIWRSQSSSHGITVLLKASVPREHVLHWYSCLAAFHCSIDSVS